MFFYKKLIKVFCEFFFLICLHKFLKLNPKLSKHNRRTNAQIY